MARDTLAGATKGDIAKATIIGIFVLVGLVVGAGAFGCTDTCPTFSQGHYDRFVDLIIYLGFAGAIYVGLKMTQNTNSSSASIPDNNR